MLNDSLIGLAIGILVISSIAWVSQWRKIRQRMKAHKASHPERETSAKPSEWPI